METSSQLTSEIFKNQSRLQNLNEIVKLLEDSLDSVHFAYNRIETVEGNLIKAIEKVKLTRSNVAQETKNLYEQMKWHRSR